MTILSCRTGLTAPSEASMPLFIVQKRQFHAFAAAQADSQKSWLKTTKFSANAGQFTCLPDQNGGMGSAVVVMGKTPLWDIAKAARDLPAGTWHPDFTFAADIAVSDIQLGWGLALALIHI